MGEHLAKTVVDLLAALFVAALLRSGHAFLTPRPCVTKVVFCRVCTRTSPAVVTLVNPVAPSILLLLNMSLPTGCLVLSQPSSLMKAPHAAILVAFTASLFTDRYCAVSSRVSFLA
jgi:hypothetical protein